MFKNTTKIEEFSTIDYKFEEFISLDYEGEYTFNNVMRPLKKTFKIKVVENIKPYVNLLKGLFDFDKLKQLFARKDFSFKFDAMHGVSGPYAKAIFQEELGCAPTCLNHCDLLPDFGGLHPDPNLTYAEDLVRDMGIFDLKKEDVP